VRRDEGREFVVEHVDLTRGAAQLGDLVLLGGGMRAAATLSTTARERTCGQLAIDLARDAAPVAASAVPYTRNLFAAGIGCQTHQPIYGFDLATPCLRRTRRG
jgi:hypothetical protein